MTGRIVKLQGGQRSGKMQELVDNLTSRCNELEKELELLRTRSAAPREHHQLRDVLRERDEVFARCEKLTAATIEAYAEYCVIIAEDNCLDEPEAQERVGQMFNDLYNATQSGEYRRAQQSGVLIAHCKKLEAERDDARQWANRRTATANSLNRQLSFAERCNDDLGCSLAHDRDRVLDLMSQLVNVRTEREEAGQWADKLHKQGTDLRAQLAEARNKALDEAKDRCGTLAAKWQYEYQHPEIIQDLYSVIGDIDALKS